MNFNIYLDDVTGQRLVAAAEEVGETKNGLIRKAVSEWLARHGKAEWPNEVLSFEGIDGMPAFETGRDQLKPPADNPLA